MIPGEIIPGEGVLQLHAGLTPVSVRVLNTGDRPVQVGSHYHFFEVNRMLQFERAQAWGRHLAIPAGTAVRFEPGEVKEIEVVDFGGDRILAGFNGLVNGRVDDADVRHHAFEKMISRGFLNSSI
jgi:urease subunit gamma/beta